MIDEIELLRRFREDLPGPTSGSWSRARAAIAAARTRPETAGTRRETAGPETAGTAGPAGPGTAGHWTGRGSRRRRLVAIAAAATATAAVAGLLVSQLPQTPRLTRPVHTAWQAARPLPVTAVIAGPASPAGTLRLTGYITRAGWQMNTGGPEPGYLTCPTAMTCYVAGDSATSSSGPSLLNALYVSNDAALSWSLLLMPTGVEFTSALSCGSELSCAAGARYQGQPVFVVTSDGGHSWTIDPLPAGAGGEIFQLSCPTTMACGALVAAAPAAPGGNHLNATFLGTTDGGARFIASGFRSGASMESLTCPTASHCVAFGELQIPLDPAIPPVEVTGDGGRTWRPGAMPRGVDAGPFPAVTCPDAGHCWVLGYVIRAATRSEATKIAADKGSHSYVTGPNHQLLIEYSELAKSADGGLTWTAVPLPASVPDPQLGGLACPAVTDCYASGEESVPHTFTGGGVNEASAVVLVTHDGGSSWSPVTFAIPSRLPAGLNADAFMMVGDIQCPQVDACVALGVSDQGSRTTPVYTSQKAVAG